jgi:hypothetical protein
MPCFGHSPLREQFYAGTRVVYTLLSLPLPQPTNNIFDNGSDTSTIRYNLVHMHEISYELEL